MALENQLHSCRMAGPRKSRRPKGKWSYDVQLRSLNHSESQYIGHHRTLSAHHAQVKPLKVPFPEIAVGQASPKQSPVPPNSSTSSGKKKKQTTNCPGGPRSPPGRSVDPPPLAPTPRARGWARSRRLPRAPRADRGPRAPPEARRSPPPRTPNGCVS